MTALTPGTPFPKLVLPRVGGGEIDTSALSAPFMTVLNVYRGLHCPRCKAQVADFTENKAGLAEQGIEIVSISTDSQGRAEESVATWAFGDMPVGYGLSIDAARDLGLFISETIREGEPAFFAEAAVFFIQADGTLWGSSINSFPFLRPTAAMIIDAAKTAHARNYPPRGNVAA